jgi:hypothetical protein
VKFASTIYAQRSLIKVLNRRSPRVEPCGTPSNTEKEETNFNKLQTEEDGSGIAQFKMQIIQNCEACKIRA